MEQPAIEGGKPIRDKFLPFSLPLIEQEEIDQVVDTLKSGWVTTGPKVKKFEQDFKDFGKAKFSLALGSCTAALHLALVALDIKENDEVITSPFTFVSTANVIVHQKAKPVFVDIDKDTYNIDAKKIEAAITDKTKAILPVHYAGHPCDMDEIMEIAKKHNLKVIEDAAHAVGAEYKGKRIGSIGDATCFSFYANKVMTTGEGGMLNTNDENIFNKASLYSLHGMDRDAWKRYSATGSWFYEVKAPGYKYNMTDIQASIGLEQLKKIDKLIESRGKIVKFYDASFKDMPEIIIPTAKEYVKHTRYIYPIRVKTDMLKIDRAQFIKALAAENIGTSVHFIPVHLHPFYRQKYGYKEGDFPIAENVYKELISIPLFPAMTEQDAQDVVDAIKKIIEFYRK